jgi:hypothetical protein
MFEVIVSVASIANILSFGGKDSGWRIRVTFIGNRNRNC